jgi:hypothetical protein
MDESSQCGEKNYNSSTGWLALVFCENDEINSKR